MFIRVIHNCMLYSSVRHGTQECDSDMNCNGCCGDVQTNQRFCGWREEIGGGTAAIPTGDSVIGRLPFLRKRGGHV